jgi:hypothetical protein
LGWEREREEEKVWDGFWNFFLKLLKFYLNLKTPTKNHAMVWMQHTQRVILFNYKINQIFLC